MYGYTYKLVFTNIHEHVKPKPKPKSNTALAARSTYFIVSGAEPASGRNLTIIQVGINIVHIQTYCHCLEPRLSPQMIRAAIPI